jgi:hypothetical protein
VELPRDRLGMSARVMEIRSPAIQVGNTLHVQQATHFSSIARGGRARRFGFYQDHNAVQVAAGG